MYKTFSEAKAFNQNITNWDFTNIRECDYIFKNADAFEKKYNNDDLKMLIKSLQCHRCCLLDKLHEEQKKIDCLDYLIYTLKKQMKED